MYEICAKDIFGSKIYVRSKFSCVRSSHDLCARALAHSLEGTLDGRWSVTEDGRRNGQGRGDEQLKVEAKWPMNSRNRVFTCRSMQLLAVVTKMISHPPPFSRLGTGTIRVKVVAELDQRSGQMGHSLSSDILFQKMGEV